MIQKAKVCLIGATAAGKSSLVARYVRSAFSDAYWTTIGVKIETRRMVCAQRTLDLVLWDLNGEDEFQTVQRSYLRGACGYLLVIDGTRRETKDVALMLEVRVREAIGPVPFVAVLNKADMKEAWELDADDLEDLRERGWSFVETSAKTGLGVEEAFERLADDILRGPQWS